MSDDRRWDELFETALRRKADDAPGAYGLATRVRARLARRRRRQVTATAAVCLTVVAGFATAGQLGDSTPDDGGTIGRQKVPNQSSMPDDWRWDSYGGIELRVPAGWGYGTTGTPPCLEPAAVEPYVGRPGLVPSIGCTGSLPPLGSRVPYVWLGSSDRPGVHEPDSGWVVETRIIGRTGVTVLTNDDALRRAILDSARMVDGVDAYGCPKEHNIEGGDLDIRPVPVDGGLTSVGAVDSIAVCRFGLANGAQVGHWPLIASSRLTGDRAEHLVNVLQAAPLGSGPNAPIHCAPSYQSGDEAIVLFVNGAAHDQEVYVRYSGCSGHGSDDGATRRRLTGPLLTALMDGPHRLMEVSSTPVADLVR